VASVCCRYLALVESSDKLTSCFTFCEFAMMYLDMEFLNLCSVIMDLCCRSFLGKTCTMFSRELWSSEMLSRLFFFVIKFFVTVATGWTTAITTFSACVSIGNSFFSWPISLFRKRFICSHFIPHLIKFYHFSVTWSNPTRIPEY